MSGIIDALNKGLKLLKHGDDDFYDRLSSRYSVALCILFAVIISTGQYAGDPLDCFTPAEFNGQWIKYTDRVCWVQNTYYVPFEDRLPAAEDVHRSHREITYYQWTPLILVMQAFLFAFPSILWGFATHHAGYSVDRSVAMCNTTEMINPENRDRLVKYLTNQFDRLLGYRREYREGWLSNTRQRLRKRAGIGFGKRYGVHLVCIYFFIKLAFIANAVGQLYLMNLVIGKGYTAYGWDVLKMAIRGEEWQESPFFPRITWCYFKIRRMGDNIHTHVVQCVLPINLFNEKIYLFLWWWFCLVAIMTFIGLLIFLPTFSPAANRRYINKYLKIMGRNSVEDKDLRRRFVEDYLRLDGVLVIWLISNNVTDLIIGEIVAALFDNFAIYRNKIFDSETNSPPPKLLPTSNLLDERDIIHKPL